MSQQDLNENDPLFAYCLASDARDADRMQAILEQAETKDGLIEAIRGIRHRFGHDESWVAQLQRERNRYQTSEKEM